MNNNIPKTPKHQFYGDQSRTATNFKMPKPVFDEKKEMKNGFIHLQENQNRLQRRDIQKEASQKNIFDKFYNKEQKIKEKKILKILESIK